MNDLINNYFNYIQEKTVKEQLQRDIDEVQNCMLQKQWKAAIVLIGSLIEAALYYYIESNDSIRTNIPKFEKRQITLSDLLVWARQQGIISGELYKLSEPIRDYRNTIHPRVQQRLKIVITENLVQIGYHVFLEVLKCINQFHNNLIEQNAKSLVKRAVESACGRQPSIADFTIYVPIIKKYGITKGTKIIERSLKRGHHE